MSSLLDSLTVLDWHITIVPHPLGESENYEPFMFECRNSDGNLQWFEGIRKDRTEMHPYYKALVDDYLATVATLTKE